MEQTEIRELVRRLARPHGRGTVIVEGAAIRAEGSDFDAVEAWMLGNGGKKQEVAKPPPSGGLHGNHFADSNINLNPATARYVMPVAAVEPPSGDDPATA